LNKDEIF